MAAQQVRPGRVYKDVNQVPLVGPSVEEASLTQAGHFPGERTVKHLCWEGTAGVLETQEVVGMKRDIGQG